MNIYYVAGLFDGEGYVYIFRKEHGNHIGYYVTAGILMCHYPTMLAIHEQFGGHLNGNRSDLRNPKHRTGFTWGVANQKAANFLRQIRPYVNIKSDEIDIALQLQANIDLHRGKYGNQRDEVLAYRDTLYQQCKALKKRTFTPLLLKGPGPSGRLRGRPPNR